MDSSVNPQPDDPHIRIAHVIHREMIRRKFNQRQHDIINFILTLSWGCGKPSAIIPQLKDFGLCGVGSNHIRGALETLVENKVIFWERSLNAFQINKHYDQWTIDAVGSFDPKKMKELIKLNIENRSPNLSKKVPEKGNDFPNQEPKNDSQKGNPIPESGNDFPKRETGISQIGNSSLPKSGNVKRDYPCHIKARGASKAIIKAIIKRSSSNKDTVTELDTESSNSSSNPEFSFGYIFRAYEKNFTEQGQVTDFEVEDLGFLFDDYGGEWLLNAMREAVRHKKKTLAYVGGILKGYQKRGGPQANIQNSEQTETIVQDDDPITILMRKADEKRLAEYGAT
ncbi:replication protein [Paenibacillus sp. OSY-SE]|uniref:replication protein n=1 Tax=Paenibacillus sp. OSY-SE TaxID=1196323 RepID=UPI0002E19066|nr:replication protein [Paenibacillus sp. OSY-SE]